jgi:hypothetical protein
VRSVGILYLPVADSACSVAVPRAARQPSMQAVQGSRATFSRHKELLDAVCMATATPPVIHFKIPAVPQHSPRHLHLCRDVRKLLKSHCSFIDGSVMIESAGCTVTVNGNPLTCRLHFFS